VLIRGGAAPPYSVLRAFMKIKLASCHLLLYVVYVPKSLNFSHIDAVVTSKQMKVSPIEFGTPCINFIESLSLF